MDEPIVDETELAFSASRSSGPGGQNVNKVETRVTLHFDLFASPSLTDEQKRRIAAKLASRINREGILRVASQRHRTREANRRAAVERFHELVAGALRRPRPRRRTRVPAAARRRRVEDKRRRGDVKKTRGKPTGWDS